MAPDWSGRHRGAFDGRCAAIYQPFCIDMSAVCAGRFGVTALVLAPKKFVVPDLLSMADDIPELLPLIHPPLG